MNNKVIKNFFILPLLLTTHLSLFGNPFGCLDDLPEGLAAEFRIAYFSPESREFRKIYGSNLVDYQFEISKRYFCDWDVWLNVDYMTKKGHSSYFRNSTHLTVVPIALGLSYHYTFCDEYDVYAGAGVNYSYLHLHDDSHFVRRHTHKWNWGGTFKLGVKKEFCQGIVLDLFVDYFVQNFHFSHHDDSSFSGYSSRYVERHSFDAGGVKVGAGLGYKF